jgi:hypothetical protein
LNINHSACINRGEAGPSLSFATLEAVFANRQKDSGDPYVGRKLARLLRKTGFAVQRMTASYDVISETLLKIGPSLAAQFAAPSYCTLQNKPGDESLFVALAW